VRGVDVPAGICGYAVRLRKLGSLLPAECCGRDVRMVVEESGAEMRARRVRRDPRHLLQLAHSADDWRTAPWPGTSVVCVVSLSGEMARGARRHKQDTRHSRWLCSRQKSGKRHQASGINDLYLNQAHSPSGIIVSRAFVSSCSPAEILEGLQ
jgi:hypothetical protein